MRWSLGKVCEEERCQAYGVAELADVSEPVGGGMMCFAGPDAWANQAAGLGMDGPVSDADLDRLVDFYVSRGVTPRIEVSAYADRSLVKGLSQRKFVVTEFENVFWRALDDASEIDNLVDPKGERAHIHSLPELTLTRVPAGDAEAVEAFVQITTRAFEDGGEPLPEIFKVLSRRMVRHPSNGAVLAMVNGEPVGGAAFELSGAVVRLFSGAVLPEWRRRGIQSALLRWRLAEGRRLGATWATVHGEPGGGTERNARRHGFVLGYCKTVMIQAGMGEPVPP